MTVIPIWLDSPGTGIIIIPTDAFGAGLSIYPPSGKPTLSIGADGVLSTVGGPTATPPPAAGTPATTALSDLCQSVSGQGYRGAICAVIKFDVQTISISGK